MRLVRLGEERHRLEVRLVAGPLARGRVALARGQAAGRVAAGVVVLHLVVVPDRDHREARVQLAQRLVGAVERVLGAVVLERQRLAHVVRCACGFGSPMPSSRTPVPPAPSGTPRRTCSRRGTRRSRRRRAPSRRRRCSSRACTRRRRRTRTSPAAWSRPAARSGSGRRGCACRASRSGSSSARPACRRPTRAFTECPRPPLVAISLRATMFRKSRSRATSSRTEPEPDTSSSRVSSVIPRGVGSPDSTPWANLPPRSRRAAAPRGAANDSSAVCGAMTRAAPAEPLRRMNWRRESMAAPAYLSAGQVPTGCQAVLSSTNGSIRDRLSRPASRGSRRRGGVPRA